VLSTPFTISILSTLGGTAVGLLALRVSRVRGWSELRWFAVIAFTSAGYAIANLSATVRAPAYVLLAASHVQMSVGLVQYWAWLRYARAFGRATPSTAERWVERLVLAGAAASLVPALAFDGTVTYHSFPLWGVVYRGAQLTLAGYLLLAAVGLPTVPLVVTRFVRAHRSGVRYAPAQAWAFVAVVLLSLSDALAATGRFPLPYLLDIGFLLPVALVAWATSLRFVESAQDLEALRGRLESLVESRTRALAEAKEALVRAERLASLGQLANGVAHQVSNPASVVTANLRYLAENHADGAEVHDVADEALVAMQRINDLVRRLADAGRIAAMPRPTTAVELRAVVERAAAEARPRLGGGVTLETEVPAGLVVRTRPEVLEQVLQSLLSNAAEALRRDRPGRIAIRAARRDGAIRLTVSDDGVGMPPEVLERAFEPFFTTKPAGRGSGLSLAISRGIVEVHGGALWLESAPDSGSTAVLVLPENPAFEVGSAPDARSG
jgi:signal transduction histidine kinase